jgi:transcriptional regulator with XRE-family HTH domain
MGIEAAAVPARPVGLGLWIPIWESSLLLSRHARPEWAFRMCSSFSNQEFRSALHDRNGQDKERGHNSAMFTQSFAIQLKQRRLQSGLRQKDLAHRLGMSQQRLSKLELGLHAPTPLEYRAIKRQLGAFRGYMRPEGITRRATENAKRLCPELRPFQPGGGRGNHFRYRVALKAYPQLVRELADSIRLRPDFADCQFHCGLIPMESTAEVLFVLRLLARGAVPVWCAPTSLGHLPVAPVDLARGDVVGHRKFPGLALPHDFYFFHVTFDTPTLDGVDVLRWNNGWCALELGADSNLPRFDEQKARVLGIAARRIFSEEIISGTSPQRKAA